MNPHADQESVLFHNRAKNALTALFHAFQQSAGVINRHRDENVFQQQQAKYTDQLEHQLAGIALEILAKRNPGTDWNQLNQSLRSFINDYIHEFRQKIRSL